MAGWQWMKKQALPRVHHGSKAARRELVGRVLLAGLAWLASKRKQRVRDCCWSSQGVPRVQLLKANIKAIFTLLTGRSLQQAIGKISAYACLEAEKR